MNTQTLRKINRLESKARRLWNLRLFPGAWQYSVAEALWNRAQAIRKGGVA